jgi:nitrite reductase (NO-forming)
MPVAKKDNKPVVAKTLPEQIKAGKAIFGTTCFACHQSEGQGIPHAFPPLAKSDYLNANTSRAIHAVMKGLSGEISVNGQKINSVMPSQNLTDEEIADVLTYVYSSWGNNKTVVTPAMVKAERSK